MIFRFLISLVLLLGGLSFNSCQKNDDPSDKLKRTVLVYLGRDNDLNDSSEEKREAIIEGWDGRGGNLLIYQDLPTGATLEAVTKEKETHNSRILYQERNENSADPAVFKKIIQQMLSEYPADSYGLILFSHASGWLPESTLTNPRLGTRSLIKDREEWMELPDFANAIPDHLFEFIIFEACYMGGIEVAYELKDKTNYLLASPAEILSPGFREVYRTSVSKLFLPAPDLTSFASDINAHLGVGSTFESLTLSLVRTSALPELARWVRQYSMPLPFPSTDEMQFFNRSSNHLFFDFGQHFSRLAESLSQKDELKKLLANCLVTTYFTRSFLYQYGGFKIDHYSGLTTYIAQEDFPYLNESYKKLKWSQAIMP